MPNNKDNNKKSAGFELVNAQETMQMLKKNQRSTKGATPDDDGSFGKASQGDWSAAALSSAAAPPDAPAGRVAPGGTPTQQASRKPNKVAMQIRVGSKAAIDGLSKSCHEVGADKKYRKPSVPASQLGIKVSGDGAASQEELQAAVKKWKAEQQKLNENGGGGSTHSAPTTGAGATATPSNNRASIAGTTPDSPQKDRPGMGSRYASVPCSMSAAKPDPDGNKNNPRGRSVSRDGGDMKTRAKSRGRSMDRDVGGGAAGRRHWHWSRRRMLGIAHRRRHGIGRGM